MSKLYWRKTLPILLATCVAGQFAAAQDSGDELEELQTLTFTGTRLTGAEVEGSLPLVTYTQEDIALSPATTPAEFLRDLPIIGGPSTQSSNFTNGTDGAARVGLRTITGGNTLILLNGRRLTPSGTGATPDLNQIPLAAIKEVQILKAGGSVTYGTSAVAGVINFIIDDEFEGLNFSIGHGLAEDGGHAAETTMNFVVGGRGAGGKFKFTIGGAFRKETDMMAPDRIWMLGGGTSFITNPGNFYLEAPMATLVPGNTGAGWYTLKTGVESATSPSDFQGHVNTEPYNEVGGQPGTRFPYENFTVAVNPNKQYSVYGNADYEMNDNWTFFSEFGYSYSELQFSLAPAPTYFDLPSTNYWLNEIFGASVVADSIGDYGYSEDGVDYAAGAYYRFLEIGPRINSIQRRSLRGVVGLKGKLSEDWSLETYLLYSDEKMDDRELNGGSEVQVASLLELDTPDAYNFFNASWLRGTEIGAGMLNPNAPNAALADLVRADNETDVFSKTELFDARIHNANLFELPAGPVEVILGTEWRRQYALSKPDSLKLSGSLGWNAADGVTEGGREVNGAYFEAGIPIIENLDLSLSGRYEDYKDEFSTDVFGVNLRYQPIRDLTLRASWSEGFVAPDLLDIFNPGFASFPELNDPYYPSTDPGRLYQVETFYVGSQETGINLLPEQADIYSVGATYSPSGIEGLDITVDWWRIEKTDLIAYSVQGLLTEFRDSYPGGNDGSMTDPPANSPFLVENGGQIEYKANDAEPVQVIYGAGPRNVAGENLSGVDFTISYRFDTDNLGSFRVVSDSSYTLEWEQQSSTTGLWNQFIGEYDGDVAYQRFRTTLSAIWNYGDWTVATDFNYMSRTRDLNVDPDEDGVKTHVEAHVEVDLVATYELPFFKSDLQSTSVTFGVENLFDEMPPLMTTAFSNNYPERNYDPRGRYWFLRIDQRF